MTPAIELEKSFSQIWRVNCCYLVLKVPKQYIIIMYFCCYGGDNDDYGADDHFEDCTWDLEEHLLQIWLILSSLVGALHFSKICKKNYIAIFLLLLMIQSSLVGGPHLAWSSFISPPRVQDDHILHCAIRVLPFQPPIFITDNSIEMVIEILHQTGSFMLKSTIRQYPCPFYLIFWIDLEAFSYLWAVNRNADSPVRFMGTIQQYSCPFYEGKIFLFDICGQLIEMKFPRPVYEHHSTIFLSFLWGKDLFVWYFWAINRNEIPQTGLSAAAPNWGPSTCPVNSLPIKICFDEVCWDIYWASGNDHDHCKPSDEDTLLVIW